MKNGYDLTNELREEYLRIQVDISKAKFAHATLELNDEERQFLKDQVEYMEGYAELVKIRAEYAITKYRKKYYRPKDQNFEEHQPYPAVPQVQQDPDLF